jgi:hypothetical protein
MQKWEYLSFEIDLGISGDGSGYTIASINDKRQGTLFKPSSRNFDEFLNELGQEGWELAGISPINPRLGAYIFKRPIIE